MIQSPTWNDLEPGDVVIEHDGLHSVFVIVKEGSIETRPHWDAVILYTEHPNRLNLTAYRSNWIRRFGSPNGPGPNPMPSNHEVIRNGVTIIRT